MARGVLVGEGGGLDAYGRAVVDLGGVDLISDLLLIEVGDVCECQCAEEEHY